MEEPISIAASPITAVPVGAKRVDRNVWEATCSSSKDKEHNCSLAIDAKGDATDWQSADVPTGTSHWIVIDLKKAYNVHSLAMKPSRDWDANGGSVRKHRVEIATVNGDWDLVAFGAWRDHRGGMHISTQFCSLRNQSADDYYRKICNV